MKKRLLGVFLGDRRRRDDGDVLDRAGDWKLGADRSSCIGNVGVAGSIVFYESLLPHLVSEEELDRVSSAGYAIGYLGGGVLLAINLLMIQRPALVRHPGRRHRRHGCRSPASASGGWCSRSRCSATCRSRRVGRGGRVAGRQPARHRCPPADRDVPRAAALQAGVPAAGRVPHLQRRHPDDHPDGDDLRQPDRHRPERDDHGAPHHAVHRRAVRVSLRDGRRAHRREDGGLRRPRRSTPSSSRSATT